MNVLKLAQALFFIMQLALWTACVANPDAWAASKSQKKPAPAMEAKPPVQQSLGIVALVNDEVITSFDVRDRIAMIIATAKLPNTPETQRGLVPQVTRQLIDDVLQQQEAKRLNITVSDEELKKAIQDLAVARGGDMDTFIAQLKSAGVPVNTFYDQARAQLAWRKVVAKMVRPKVKVSDEELQLARIQVPQELSLSQALELQLMTMTLPVDKPEQDGEVKTLAEKLVQDLRAGASFEAIAKQFGATSPEPVWLPIAQMDPGLAKALEKAVPGSVSNPARTPNGYIIIKLLNRRSQSSAALNDSQLLLKNLTIKAKDSTILDEAKLMDIAQDVARHPGNCSEATIDGVGDMDKVDIQSEFINARFSELEASVQEMVQNLSVGNVSAPVSSDDGVQITMLCERIDAPPEMADTEQTYAKLMNDKLELEAQKYMRNLRREAYIELHATR